jgi:hypothetical protein
MIDIYIYILTMAKIGILVTGRSAANRKYDSKKQLADQSSHPV